jgi:pSer/pThr/pTyr-binding forkhead associated (FHA) protein
MSIKFIVRWKDEDQQLQEMERVYTKNSVSIGRHIRNDFCIPNRFASSYHARIEFSNNNYVLYDLGSTNGSYLNGKKLEQNEQKIIKNGDIITIADNEIVLSFKKRAKEPSQPATASMQKAAYESINKLLTNSISDASFFESEEDIRMFCDRLQEVLQIFITEFISSLEIYSKLQYELDIHEMQLQHREYNPLELKTSQKDVAKHLLDWNTDDKLSARSFLKKAFDDVSRSQKVILKILESILPALLEKISPESIQKMVDKSLKDSKSYKIYSDKIFMQTYKNMWNEYVKRYKELIENKNKRFEIIKNEFQKAYLEISDITDSADATEDIKIN